MTLGGLCIGLSAWRYPFQHCIVKVSSSKLQRENLIEWSRHLQVVRKLRKSYKNTVVSEFSDLVPSAGVEVTKRNEAGAGKSRYLVDAAIPRSAPGSQINSIKYLTPCLSKLAPLCIHLVTSINMMRNFYIEWMGIKGLYVAKLLSVLWKIGHRIYWRKSSWLCFHRP